MKYISKDKEVQVIKEEFVYLLIDHICNEGNNLEKLLKMMEYVSLNPICLRLLKFFLNAISNEDYASAQNLKNEIIQFIDV